MSIKYFFIDFMKQSVGYYAWWRVPSAYVKYNVYASQDNAYEQKDRRSLGDICEAGIAERDKALQRGEGSENRQVSLPPQH